jgi:hypothetical protein
VNASVLLDQGGEIGEKVFSNLPPPGGKRDEGPDDCIGKALKEDPHLSTRKIVKTLNIRCTSVRDHLTKSWT